MTLARRTSVVVPAFNEEHAVGPIVSGLQRAADWREILASSTTAAPRRRDELGAADV